MSVSRRSSRRRSALLATMVSFALVTSACGGSDGQTESAASAPDETTAPELVEAETSTPDDVDVPATTTGTDESAETSGETVRIGGMFALSGPGAQVGQAANDALAIWIEQANEAGGLGGRPVEAVVIDTQSDPTKAVAAARRFVEEEGVLAVMTAGIDTEVMATKDYLNDNKMLTFAGSGCDCIYIDGVQEYIFKIPETQPVVLDFQMRLAARDGITKMAWLGDSGGFGQAGLGFAKEFAEANGIEIVAEASFGFGDTNMTTQATQVGSSDAEAILVFSIPPAASIAQANIRDLGLEQQIYHSYGSGSQGFIDAAAGAAEGVVLVSPKVIVAADLPESYPQFEAINDYLEAGNPPVRFAVDLWDSMLLLEAAVDAVGVDSEAIQDFLETEITGFVGVGGVRTLTAEDHTGLGPDSLIAARVTDGRFVLEATASDLYDS